MRNSALFDNRNQYIVRQQNLFKYILEEKLSELKE